MSIEYEACEIKRLDYKEVQTVVNAFNRAMKKAEKLNLIIFGGSGTGTLRTYDDTVIAHLHGCYDGGDGGAHEDNSGILRGETWWTEHNDGNGDEVPLDDYEAGGDGE